MDWSILIVNWNTSGSLYDCLLSISRWPPDSAYEVIVVDNASSDDSPQIVREQFPSVRLIENQENVGFAAASNQAIRRAQGRYLVLLNSDTEVRPGALDTLVQFMDAHPRAGAAGARLLNPDGSLQPSCHPMLTPGREFWSLLFLDRLLRRATYPMHRWDPSIPRQVEAIKGACLLLRREALEEVGLLDDSYFMYTEEVDLCYRLHRAGWELWWVPRAEVVHHEAQSTRQAAEKMYIQLYRSKVQFYRKFGGQRRAQRFKRLVRLAYGARLVAAKLGSFLSPRLEEQARIYKQLLAQLSQM